MANKKETNQKNKKNLFRFPLDFASKFYPIYATKKSQSLFCCGANMKEIVDPSILKKAIVDTLEFFPSFKVALKSGFAWYYFEENNNDVKVFEMDDKYLRPIKPSETNGYQFRFSYAFKKVKMDIFHGLCDGNGGMMFFKAVIQRYQELRGEVFDDSINIYNNSNLDSKEIEDGFEKYYKHVSLSKIDLKTMAGKAPHLLKGTAIEGENQVVTVESNSLAIAQCAKDHSVSITSFIVGMIAYSISKVSKSKKPITVMVPINLRAFFPTKTVRNFVTFIRVVIKPDSCSTLEEYVKETQNQIKEKAVQPKLETALSTMVKTQKNFILKIAPLFVKRICFKIGRIFMKSRHTIIISNLGKIQLPQQMGIERLFFNMNCSKNNPVNFTCMTLGEKTVFAFTRCIKETSVIDSFVESMNNEKINTQVVEA